MRAVSAGMGPMAWGYIVMLLLLLSARRFRFPVSYHFYFYFHSPAESFRVARVLFISLKPCNNTITHPTPRATDYLNILAFFDASYLCSCWRRASRGLLRIY